MLCKMNFTSLRPLVLTAFLAIAPVLAVASEVVGEVLFAIGDARVVANGARLKKGDGVTVGQAVTTGANGHVHIRFIDDAFVSVRPNSRLQVEQYTYNTDVPEKNRVRFILSQGVARLITGTAGQAAKDNFRLNTPVAAIGIRGTDFLVQASDALTRVAVQQGAVVVSPFSSDCSAGALGPCSGVNARSLAGSLTGNYLEVSGAGAPTLVTAPSGKLPFGLPRPEEPRVNVNGGGANSAVLPEGMSGSHSLMWGRWSGQTTAPAGYEVIGQNDALVLFRSIEAANLPRGGDVQFRLLQSEAYGRRSDSGYDPARVSNPALSVNFDKMRYSTSFQWQFGEKTSYIYSTGGISDTGRMVVDRDTSNASLSGALSANGDEAAYVYFKNIDSELKAYGILRWGR